MSNGNRIRLRSREVAEELCVSRSTLAKWRMKGAGPPHHRCGLRIVYYYQSEIDHWLEECDARERAAKSRSRKTNSR
jgi:predicted DNA-binding transcriptional regulator AlpA